MNVLDGYTAPCTQTDCKNYDYSSADVRRNLHIQLPPVAECDNSYRGLSLSVYIYIYIYIYSFLSQPPISSRQSSSQFQARAGFLVKRILSQLRKSFYQFPATLSSSHLSLAYLPPQSWVLLQTQPKSSILSSPNLQKRISARTSSSEKSSIIST
jgi:hypothetical protein